MNSRVSPCGGGSVPVTLLIVAILPGACQAPERYGLARSEWLAEWQPVPHLLAHRSHLHGPTRTRARQASGTGVASTRNREREVARRANGFRRTCRSALPGLPGPARGNLPRECRDSSARRESSAEEPVA